MTSIVLYGATPSKKNSRINTRSGRSFPSSKYTAWHKDAIKQLEGIRPIPEPVFLHVTFFAGDNRKFDLTNKAESILDTLVDAGLLRDDNYSVVQRLTLNFGGVDKGNPHCVIEY